MIKILHSVTFMLGAIAYSGFVPTAFAGEMPSYGSISTPSYDSVPLSSDATDPASIEPLSPSTQSAADTPPSALEQFQTNPVNDKATVPSHSEAQKDCRSDAASDSQEGCVTQLPSQSAKKPVLDIVVLRQKIQVSFQELSQLEKSLKKQKKVFSFFGIPIKPAQSRIASYRSSLLEVEKTLTSGDAENAHRLMDNLERFEIAELGQSIQKLETVHAVFANVRQKQTTTLLLKPFKSIHKTMKSGDFSNANAALGLYVEEFGRNKKLYLSKKITPNVKKQIEKNMKNLGIAVASLQGKRPMNETPSQEVTSNSASKNDSRIDELNKALQRRVQFDAIIKTFDLGSGIR